MGRRIAEQPSDVTRILVVDDSEMMRQSLRNLLEGHENWQVCEEAGTGQEAVDKLNSLRPDIVIMDYHMPQMDGLETATRITSTFPQLPILMLTLYLNPHLVEQARQAGFSGACSKSDISCVVNAVETLLHHGTYFQN